MASFRAASFLPEGFVVQDIVCEQSQTTVVGKAIISVNLLPFWPIAASRLGKSESGS
jgi:hypothetical protein